MANKVEIILEATDRASGTIGGLGKALGGLGAIAAGVVAGGLVLAGKALSDFVSAAMDAEQVQAKFNAQVAGSPLAGYKSEMEALAQSLSTLTRFEDENILAAEGMLATYQTIGQEIFPEVMNATLDLAELMGTDAVGAAESLGRALSDISGGSLSLLTRQRLLTKEQEAMAKKIYETNGAAAAQEYVIGILDDKIGTLAETMANTTAGQFQIFENALGNIKETLGAALIPAFAKLAQVLSEKLADPAVQEWISQFAQTLADIALQGVAGIEALSTALSDVFGFIQKIQGGMNFRTALVTSFEHEAIQPFVEVLDAMQPIFDGLSTVISGLVPQVQSFVNDALKLFSDWYIANGPLIQEFGQMIAEIWVNNIAPALVAAWGIISPILLGLLDLILNIATLIMQVATGDWAGAWETIQTTAQNVVMYLEQAIYAFLNTIATLFGSSMAQIGSMWSSNWNMLQQIVSKIKAMIIASVMSMMAQMVAGIVAGITTVLQQFDELRKMVEVKMREVAKMLFERAIGWMQQIAIALRGTAQVVIDALNDVIAEIQAGIVGIVIPVTWGSPGPYTGPGGVDYSAPGNGGGCFVAGTGVLMADWSTRAIETIEVGDKVLSWDIVKRDFVEAEIVETFHHEPDDIDGYLFINGIGVTPNHLIYAGEWRPAGQLQIGDVMLGYGGLPLPVQEIIRVDGRVRTYNLHTNHETHNYFADGVLVHNTKPQYAEGTGGWMTVPNGFPNDNYPIFLTSGERFAVVPQDQSAPMGNITINVGSVRSDEDIREIAYAVSQFMR